MQPVSFISILSIILLVFISPVHSFIWLFIFTLYFLYESNRNIIYKIWGVTLGIWYVIFTVSLYEIPIWIGGSNTKLIANYLIQNQVFFDKLCFQTLVMFDALSNKIGISIYIPSIFGFLLKLLQFLGGNGKADCSGKGDSNNTNTNQQSKKKSSWWSRGPRSVEDQTARAMEDCPDLSRAVNQAAKESKSWARPGSDSVSYHEASSDINEDGNVTTARRVKIPFFNPQYFCHYRKATAQERKQQQSNEDLAEMTAKYQESEAKVKSLEEELKKYREKEEK